MKEAPLAERSYSWLMIGTAAVAHLFLGSGLEVREAVHDTLDAVAGNFRAATSNKPMIARVERKIEIKAGQRRIRGFHVGRTSPRRTWFAVMMVSFVSECIAR